MAVIINMVWGSMFVAAAIGLREFPPILFTGIRFLILFILLISFFRVSSELTKPLLIIGLLMGFGMYLTLYLSIALADNTSSVAIFSKLEVPFAIILSVIVLKEKIGIRRILGVVIAMFGAMIISFDPAAFSDLPALFWMTISCFFSAFAMIKVRVLGSVHPLTITAWVSLVGASSLLLISLMFESNHWQAIENASLIGWSALLYTAIMSSIIAQSGIYYLLQRYEVSQVAPFFLLSPIFAVVGGVLILDDQLTVQLMVGGLMILAGVGWIYLRDKRVTTEIK